MSDTPASKPTAANVPAGSLTAAAVADYASDAAAGGDTDAMELLLTLADRSAYQSMIDQMDDDNL